MYYLPLELGISDSVDLIEELIEVVCSIGLPELEMVVVTMLIMGPGVVGLEMRSAEAVVNSDSWDCIIMSFISFPFCGSC